MKKLFLFLISMLLLVATVSASATITPSVAYGNSDLTCTFGSTPAAYVYKWYLGSDYKTTGKTLSNTYTTPTETWTCKVFLPPTPIVPTEVYVGESSMYITNQIPTVPTLALSSGPYYANTVITATASGSTDADGDTVTYQYKFEKAGVSISTSSTLNCNGNCSKLDAIIAYARAYDGHEYSVWAQQSFTISNSVPTIPSLTLSSGPYFANSVVTSTASGSTDADTDAVTYDYKYERNSLSIGTTAVLNCNAATCAKGQNITVFARAFDGTAYSAYTSLNFTISNALPANLVINYAPSIVYSNSILVVSASATDADIDTLIYAYKFVDMSTSIVLQDYSATSSYTLNSALAGHTIRIYVNVTDGTSSTVSQKDVAVNSGTTTVTGPYAYCSVNSSNSIIGIVEITNLDDIQNKELEPLEKFDEIKVKVRNSGTDDKNVYVKAVIVKGNSTVSDTEVESEKIKMVDGSEKTFRISNMSIPVDLSAGDYSLYIKAYDSGNSLNCEQRIIPFRVTQDEDKIVASETQFSPSTQLICGDLFTFSGKLANIGSKDQDKVKLVYEDDFKNKLTPVEFDNLNSGELKDFNFDVTVPTNTTETKHKVTLTAYYNYDEDNDKFDDKNSYNFYVTVSGCKASKQTIANLTTLDLTAAQQKKAGFSIPEFFSNNWPTIVIVIEALAVLIVLLKILSMSRA